MDPLFSKSLHTSLDSTLFFLYLPYFFFNVHNPCVKMYYKIPSNIEPSRPIKNPTHKSTKFHQDRGAKIFHQATIRKEKERGKRRRCRQRRSSKRIRHETSKRTKANRVASTSRQRGHKGFFIFPIPRGVDIRRQSQRRAGEIHFSLSRCIIN